MGANPEPVQKRNLTRELGFLRLLRPDLRPDPTRTGSVLGPEAGKSGYPGWLRVSRNEHPR
eukprot:1177104-Prorocentrum_minimum.AAC.4